MRLSIGCLLINYISNRFSFDKRKCNQILVLIVTFLVYCCYHMMRRPLSIVKSKLYHKNCSDLLSEEKSQEIYYKNNTQWCDWAPFDKTNAESLLGLLDTCFLASYAIFMFVSGYIAERSNLRYFLTISLTICGIFLILAGIAFPLKIHNLYYFIIIQIINGIVQTTGWPAVVAAVGNWFGKAKKGFIFGIWSWHTSVGNILGATIAGAFVEYNLGLAFIVPGIIAIAMAVFVFLFLIPNPKDIGLTLEDNKHINDMKNPDRCENASAISFFGAIKIPGVIEFSICLFFAKLVSYTFLYWLPLYINESIKVSSSESAYLSISFEIGGAFGAMLAGFIADRSGASAITCIIFLILGIPSLFIYYEFGTKSMTLNQCLQLMAGLFVNGPYTLIITSISADLATKVDSKSALATVSAIIDGTGSIGAAIGPALAGYVEGFGWQYVFYIVMIANAFAVITLLRTGFNELKRIQNKKFNENIEKTDL